MDRTGGDRCTERIADFLVLVVFPLVVFGVPTLLGHPPLAGDNLIQNYPLRVLSGRDIASGHLPLFNPLANSGTPLLGGMNSGSLYPLTLLFAFLPGLLAWVINMAAVYGGAALGMYALLRWQRIRPFPALFAAVSYAYGGAMLGQMVHLGVIQGFSLIPWMVLAQLHLCHSVLGQNVWPPWRRMLRQVMPSLLGLTTLWALVFLTGEPRAYAEFELLVIVAVPVTMVMHEGVARATWRGRSLALGVNALGLGWGAVVAMIQLLPGWAFISVSQRSNISYAFYGSGSLAIKWSSLLFIPDLLGGNGVLSQPSFFVNYNLPEVTGYVGIVALVAVFAYLAQFTRRGWVGNQRPFAIYVVVFVVGLFAAWGSFGPLGHLFHLIPFYGKTRLQSRNIVLVDFAATALLGWWLNALSEKRYVEASLFRWRRYVTLAPLGTVVVLVGFMLFHYAGTLSWIGDGSGGSAFLGAFEKPTLLIHLGIALAVLAVVLAMSQGWHWRLRVGRWHLPEWPLQRWLMAFITLDLLVFAVFCSTGLVPGHVQVEPSRSSAASVLGTKGRYALIDPTGSEFEAFEDLGTPNLNVFTRLPSIQGYGSLEGSHYSNITGTHPLGSVDPCQLALGTFNQLRLATVAINAQSLVQPLSATPTPNESCPYLKLSSNLERFFGQTLDVSSVDIVPDFVPGAGTSRERLSLQLMNANGHLFGPIYTASSESRDVFAIGGVPAAGFRVVATRRFLDPSTQVTTATTTSPSVTYTLNSLYQDAFETAQWQRPISENNMAVFHATTVKPPVWIASSSSTAVITSTHSAFYGDTWFTAHSTTPFRVERSVAWLPGWRVTAINTRTHRAISVLVTRRGLIQEISLPAGSWNVHFHYHAPYITIGVIVSGVGVVALGVAVWMVRPYGRRRTTDRVGT